MFSTPHPYPSSLTASTLDGNHAFVADKIMTYIQQKAINVTDVPRGSTKHVRFTEEAAIQDLREHAEKILAIRESEELVEEAIRLGRMVSSNTPLY